MTVIGDADAQPVRDMSRGSRVLATKPFTLQDIPGFCNFPGSLLATGSD
ncbi:hypothetical protein [Salinisphaera sp. G21_0]|nr:hypothetical protein [Salinisphaera sp. G21_0]MBO9481199.1 hypothetical protein [Salinisphaera sp. G21_0]